MKTEKKLDSNIQKQIEDFLSISHEFKLGHLITEKPHSSTQNLSSWANANIPRALKAFHELDANLLNVLHTKLV